MGVNAAPAAAIAAAVFGAVAGTMDQATAAANIEAALDTLSTPANLTASIAAQIASSEALQGAIKVFTIRGVGATTAALPGGGNDGDVWVIGTPAHGFAWYSGAWHDIGQLQGADGADAVPSLIVPVPYSFGPGERVVFFTLDRAFTISAENSRQAMRLVTPPQGAFALTIKRNGVLWATVSWAAGQQVPTTFVFAAGGGTAALLQNDLIEVFAPSPSDALAAFLSFVLSGA